MRLSKHRINNCIILKWLLGIEDHTRTLQKPTGIEMYTGMQIYDGME